MMDRRHAEDALAGELEEATCSITDAVSSTKIPPMTQRDHFLAHDHGDDAEAAPIASAPTSPMKTCAGYVLNQRNPRPAPASEAQKIRSSPAPRNRGMPR